MSGVTMSNDEIARRKGNPLGPTGERVSRNITQLREARGLSYRELSERLKEVGRPIHELGLSRIEKGTRRVDADDLFALAIVFGVTPNHLILPEGARDMLSAIDVERHRPLFVEALHAILALKAQGLPLDGVLDYIEFTAVQSDLLPSGAVFRPYLTVEEAAGGGVR